MQSATWERAHEILEIESGGATLTVRRWRGEGTPLVLLHPGVVDSRIWQWCAPIWADAGHDVTAYDRRGFGVTRYEPEPHDDLDDLRAIVAAPGAHRSVVVGNSMGGQLALRYALELPEAVAALVLIAHRWRTMTWPTGPRRLARNAWTS